MLVIRCVSLKNWTTPSRVHLTQPKKWRCQNFTVNQSTGPFWYNAWVISILVNTKMMEVYTLILYVLCMKNCTVCTNMNTIMPIHIMHINTRVCLSFDFILGSCKLLMKISSNNSASISTKNLGVKSHLSSPSWTSSSKYKKISSPGWAGTLMQRCGQMDSQWFSEATLLWVGSLIVSHCANHDRPKWVLRT